MILRIVPSKNMTDSKANVLLKNCVKEISTIERELLLIAEKFGVSITYVNQNSQSIKNKKFKKIIEELEREISRQLSISEAINFKNHSEIFLGLRGSISHCNLLKILKKLPGMTPIPVSIGNDPSMKYIQTLTEVEYNQLNLQKSLNFTAQYRGFTVSKLWFRQFRKVLQDILSKHPSNSGFNFPQHPLIKQCEDRHDNLHLHLFFWEFYLRKACQNKGIKLFELDLSGNNIVSKSVNTLRHELYSLNLISVTPAVKLQIENIQYLRNKFIHGLLIEFAKKCANVFGKQYNGANICQMNTTSGSVVPLNNIYQNTPHANMNFNLFGLLLHVYGSGIDNDVVSYKVQMMPHIVSINDE